MLKLLPLLYFWYRVGAFTKPWAAPGATDADFHAMRRATRIAFYVSLGFSLLGFIGPALFPALRHAEGAQTFSTICVIAGLVIGLVFDVKAELLRHRGTAPKRQSIYLPPAWLKKNERFSKGVEKFIAYQRDLMPEDKLAAVLEAKRGYDHALRDPDKAALEELEKKVLRTCETAVPDYNASPLKENLEVIIVAIIVALGIRAYYLQPFKIPTASMQPTLNGIIGTRMKEAEDKPNIFKQAWEYAWNGRNYVECRVPEEWGEVELVSFQQASKANFFTFTTLTFSNGQQITKYAPARQLLYDLCQNGSVSAGAAGATSDDNPQPVAFGSPTRDTLGNVRLEPRPIKLHGGELISKGFVESGDQLLVDKFSYHFRSPRRDEVFVFGTKNIEQIGKSQHYIKRLVAIPGDRLAVEPPKLLVNGKITSGRGSAKVMSQENGYPGYTMPSPNPRNNFVGQGDGTRTDEVTLGPNDYMAMGDNSSNSFDSRNWGPVPQKDIVGPAFLVYWPFANHWGLIP